MVSFRRANRSASGEAVVADCAPAERARMQKPDKSRVGLMMGLGQDRSINVSGIHIDEVDTSLFVIAIADLAQGICGFRGRRHIKGFSFLPGKAENAVAHHIDIFTITVAPGLMVIVGVAGFPDIEQAFMVVEPDLKILDGGRIVTEFLEGCVDAPGGPVVVDRSIETGGVEPPDVFEADPATAFFFGGGQPGSAVCQIVHEEREVKAPFVIGGAFIQHAFFQGGLERVIPEYGDVAAVADGVELRLEADMSSFVLMLGVPEVFRAVVIGIGEPEGPEDDEGGVRRFGTCAMEVQEVRDLAAGGPVKNELAVVIMAEIRDAGMDTDTAGIGSFVDDLKMAETRRRGGVCRRVKGVVEPDGNGIEGGQRRWRLGIGIQCQQERRGQ
jgi:hypothetical protein